MADWEEGSENQPLDFGLLFGDGLQLDMEPAVATEPNGAARS